MVSFLFLQASTKSDAEMLKDSVVILFLSDLDEYLYLGMKRSYPEWVAHLEEQILSFVEGVRDSRNNGDSPHDGEDNENYEIVNENNDETSNNIEVLASENDSDTNNSNFVNENENSQLNANAGNGIDVELGTENRTESNAEIRFLQIENQLDVETKKQDETQTKLDDTLKELNDVKNQLRNENKLDGNKTQLSESKKQVGQNEKEVGDNNKHLQSTNNELKVAKSKPNINEDKTDLVQDYMKLYKT